MTARRSGGAAGSANGRLAGLLAAAALVVVLLAACGGSGDDADDSADPSASGDSAAAAHETTAPPTTDTIPHDAVALPDLVITSVGFGEDGVVLITNMGSEPDPFNGVWLCQGASHLFLGDMYDPPIPAEAMVTIDAEPLGGLSIEGGELALYAGDECSDPDAMFGFVQWGTGGSRHSAAAARGLWPAGATVTPDPQYGNIELGGDPADSESWS